MTVCDGLDVTLHSSLAGLLSFPTSCDHYFYAKVMGGIWLILTMVLYYSEKKSSVIKPEFLSLMGVSAMVTLFLTGLLSLLGAAQGVAIISSDVFAEIFTIGGLIIAIWLLKQ